jgi:hypothetical protein
MLHLSECRASAATQQLPDHQNITIKVYKLKEMLRDGGYRTFADFGLELDQYEKSKIKLLQAHYNF